MLEGEGIYARVREKGAIQRMNLTRYEQETIINFNAAERTAELYIRDPAIIRQLDSLVTEYPDTFKCISETDIDKTYEMPKSAVTYRKPRRLSDERREEVQAQMKAINESGAKFTDSSRISENMGKHL